MQKLQNAENALLNILVELLRPETVKPSFAAISECSDCSEISECSDCPNAQCNDCLVQPLKIVKVQKHQQALAVAISEITTDEEILERIDLLDLGILALAMSGDVRDIKRAIAILKELEVSTDTIEEQIEKLEDLVS